MLSLNLQFKKRRRKFLNKNKRNRKKVKKRKKKRRSRMRKMEVNVVEGNITGEVVEEEAAMENVVISRTKEEVSSEDEETVGLEAVVEEVMAKMKRASR